MKTQGEILIKIHNIKISTLISLHLPPVQFSAVEGRKIKQDKRYFINLIKINFFISILYYSKFQECQEGTVPGDVHFREEKKKM